MQSNVRFVIIWAALMPVLTGVALLVGPLGIAPWSEVQTGLVVTEVNALSAVVLAVVAYLWAQSVKEPAALQGSVSVFALATLTLGTGFGWWSLTDQATQLVIALVGAVLVFVLTAFNRMVAFAPETVAIEKAKAATPDAVLAAMAPKLVPPTEPVAAVPPEPAPA